MAEPKTRAARIDRLLPWLFHWTITDERIGEFRSDSFAVETPEGLMLIDPLPLQEDLQDELGKVGGMKDDVCICLQLAAYFTQLETQRAADMFSKLD